MNIGPTIKKYRRNRDMTQEELAEYMNISPQAVSRWETNLAMPDITMLPGLANLFGITVDELLGMEELRSQAWLHEIYRSAHAHISGGDYAKAEETLRKAIRTFPNHHGLMSELALSLSFGDMATKEGRDAAEEAIKLCERVLAGNTSDKLRGTTRANLCYLYKVTGKGHKAAELGRSLPHVWESREMILPELLGGQEATSYLKTAILLILWLLCEKIEAVESGETQMKKMLATGPDETPATAEGTTGWINKIVGFLGDLSEE